MKNMSVKSDINFYSRLKNSYGPKINKRFWGTRIGGQIHAAFNKQRLIS